MKDVDYLQIPRQEVVAAKDILKANDLNVLGNNRKTQDNRAAFKTGNVIIENTVAASFPNGEHM